jgi:hypothetical protein
MQTHSGGERASFAHRLKQRMLAAGTVEELKAVFAPGETEEVKALSTRTWMSIEVLAIALQS